MTKLIAIFLTFFSATALIAQSNQACPYIDAGPDRTFDCTNPCVALNATYLKIKQTTSYVVDSLPYVLPIPYGQTGGTAVSANTDDVWGPIITLPFPFCYYGNTYTTCKIGSNGAILFGPSSGGGGHPWSFSASLTPTSGINGAGHVLGIYHDIDPSVCGNIKWYLVGQAPCRQFIVAFDNICQFSCTSIKSRHMMVLNEGTNYIDVYVESKPTCSTWNGGRAVIGLQYINQNGGITAPGRNSAPLWNVTVPEAWRFKPDGAELQSVEWYDGNTLVGTGDSITVCPTQSTNYTAKLSFTICGTSNVSSVSDVVAVTTDPSSVQISQTDPLCFGDSTGVISVTTNGVNAPFTYQLDSLPVQSSNIFNNLPSGTYSVSATDSTGCRLTQSVTINQPQLLQMSLDSVASTTCNLPNGTFIMSTLGGTGTYMYSVDTFLNISTTGIFENTYPGYFHVLVNDANGCTDTMTVFVPAEPAVSASITTYQNPSCNGFSDGSFSVNAWGGPTPYTYTFNNVVDSIGTYTGISAGPQNVIVTDSLGCQSSATIILSDPPLLTVSIDPTTVVCAGTQVTLNAVTTGGTAPYLYVWNTVLPGNPINVSPNTTTDYTVLVQDSHGCDTTATITQQILPVPVATVTASPNSGFAPLSVSFTNTSTNANTYAWDFGNGQTALTTSLQSTNALYADTGTYNVTMIASNGICETSWNQIISVVPLLVVEAPNVFTPNDDNANDGYQLIMRNATGIEATIFNRWGEIMVKISDVNYKWDGKNKSGAKASEGVYFIKYHVTGPNNQEFEGQTFFHLVR